MKESVNFVFEAGFLKRLARTGYPYLGSGHESVAEHTCGMLYNAFVLAQYHDGVDMTRLLKMCLFHDLPETRIGDLNYVNKKYVTADEEKAVREQTERLPFGKEIVSLLHEFNEKETLEAKIAHDADQLDLLFHVKVQADIGNLQAEPWLDFAYKRLITETARQLARTAMETDSTDWWFPEEERLEEDSR